MELNKLTDRVIVDFQSLNQERVSNYDIYQTLHKIGEDIYNGYVSGQKQVNEHEVLWEYEDNERGFRTGIVHPDLMQEIRDLLNDYDEREQEIGEDICLKTDFLSDAIGLLSRITEEQQ